MIPLPLKAVDLTIRYLLTIQKTRPMNRMFRKIARKSH